jgi:hypothetical protein
MKAHNCEYTQSGTRFFHHEDALIQYRFGAGRKLSKLMAAMSAAAPAMAREEELAEAETQLEPVMSARASLAPVKRLISLQRLRARLGREAQRARAAAVERAEALAAQQMTLAAERLAQEVTIIAKPPIPTRAPALLMLAPATPRLARRRTSERAGGRQGEGGETQGRM